MRLTDWVQRNAASLGILIPVEGCSERITVYSKPRCPQCDATYRALDKQGVSYEKIDVTQDAESLAFIKGLGYQQAPVVVAGEDHWSGFRPDRIKAVAAAAAPLALQA